MEMVAYFGSKRETEVTVQVEDIGCGAGKITCVECGGDGDWTKFHPESDTLPQRSIPCVDCKGQGWILIGI